MKKIVSLLLVLIVALGFSATALAAGISPAEQKILDELNAGVTVSGKRFNLPGHEINSATNHLKVTDVRDEDAHTVVGNIHEARGLIEGTNIQANSGKELREKLPPDVLARVLALASASKSLVGLGGVDPVTQKPLDTNGKVIASGSPVKKTGANYTTSIVLFSSLMVASLGAAVIGKKYNTKLA